MANHADPATASHLVNRLTALRQRIERLQTELALAAR